MRPSTGYTKPMYAVSPGKIQCAVKWDLGNVLPTAGGLFTFDKYSE